MSTSADTLVLILVGITAGWAILSFFVMRRSRHRRREVAVFQAQPRRRERPVRLREESGTFVPLAPVAADDEELLEPEPEEPEPGPEEPELEPEDYAPAPSGLETATTYEVVWYRDGDEDRIAFALQPVDGRAAPWARYRSASFSWGEDRDPPATLRAAQSAHGRLRARLERDGWTSSGRGPGWFSHRFEPPVSAPRKRSSGDDD